MRWSRSAPAERRRHAACLGAPLAEVREALEALAREMLIYCTTDTNHFRLVNEGGTGGDGQPEAKRSRTE